jgi:hypothetical protein
MKTKIFLLLLCCITFLPAQDKIFFALHPGYMLYTSENSSNALGSKEVNWMAGGSVSIEDRSLFDVPVLYTYDLSFSYIKNVQEFAYTSEYSSDPIGSFGPDYSLYFNTIEAAVLYQWKDNIYLSFGPSVSWVNRSIIFNNLPGIPQGISKTSLVDRVASLCGGFNASLLYRHQLTEDEFPMYVFLEAKFRYLHSLWIDARGRNVSGYTQSFFIGQLNVGIGMEL